MLKYLPLLGLLTVGMAGCDASSDAASEKVESGDFSIIEQGLLVARDDGTTRLALLRRVTPVEGGFGPLEYEGRRLGPGEAFSIIELRVSDEAVGRLAGHQGAIPEGVELIWHMGMSVNDQNHPLCLDSQLRNHEGDQQCGSWFTPITFRGGELTGELARATIGTLDARVGGRLDLEIEFDAFERTELDGRTSYCCGAGSIVLDTVVKGDGEFTVKSIELPNTWCDFESLEAAAAADPCPGTF